MYTIHPGKHRDEFLFSVCGFDIVRIALIFNHNFMPLFGFTSSMSRYQKPLKTKEIKKIVSRVSILTLDRKEEELVENEIDKARGSDGKISLRQIEEVLRRLFSKKQISRSDKKKLMEHFEDYFNKKFGDST